MIAETEHDLLMRATRDCLSRGYPLFQKVKFPEGKDFEEVKKRLESEFEYTECRTKRSRRKALGYANVIILFFDNHFYIFATEGENKKVQSEKFLDIRKEPFFINSRYVIKSAPHKNTYKTTVYLHPSYKGNIKRTLSIIAKHEKKKVIKRFRNITPYTFDGINKQMRGMLEVVNRKRKTAGLVKLKYEDIKPFWVTN